MQHYTPLSEVHSLQHYYSHTLSITTYISTTYQHYYITSIMY